MSPTAKPLCPNCEWPLNPKDGRWRCGICGYEPKPDEAPLDSAAQLARAKALLRQGDEQLGDWQNARAETLPPWKRAVGFVGLPVAEDDSSSFESVGALLFLLVLALTLLPEEISARWIFDPREPWRHGGATFLSYAFLNHFWISELFNLLLLWPFVGRVEASLGHARFGFLLLVSALATSVAGSFTASSPFTGLGGVALAVIAFHAVHFPKRRFLILMPVVGWLKPSLRLRVRSRTLLAVLAVTQLFDPFGSFGLGEGATGAPALGLLAGLLTGLAFAALVPRESEGLSQND